MRFPLLAALLAVALAAPGAHAAARPQIRDAVGDAVPPISAGYDIVSGLFSTEGVTERVDGRKVYTPTKLVVTVTYAATVPEDPFLSQVVWFDAPGCIDVYLQRYAGGTWGTATCVAGSFDFAVKAKGRTVTFTLPFEAIGTRFLFPGAVLTGLRAYTSVADPVFGYESYQLAMAGVGIVDDARANPPYKIA